VRKTFNAAAAAAAAVAAIPLPQASPFERCGDGGSGGRLVEQSDSSRLASRLAGEKTVAVGRWLISRGLEPGYTKKLRPLEASKEQSLAASSDLRSPFVTLFQLAPRPRARSSATPTSQKPDRVLLQPPAENSPTKMDIIYYLCV